MHTISMSEYNIRLLNGFFPSFSDKAIDNKQPLCQVELGYHVHIQTGVIDGFSACA